MHHEKVIFIDRDGVINVDLMGYVTRWHDFRFEKDAEYALAKLHAAGYKIIIISNQAGVGDGVFTESEFRKVHDEMVIDLMAKGIPITDAFFCLHGKNDGCACRKPEVGLLEKASEKYHFIAEETWFIGDKATDVQAGKRFGLKTFFVRTGHGKEDEKKFTAEFQPDARAENLASAVETILR